MTALRLPEELPDCNSCKMVDSFEKKPTILNSNPGHTIGLAVV
jgi:hypothetical protein